jgi:SHS family lactate transporter-like MFS transporter
MAESPTLDYSGEPKPTGGGTAVFAGFLGWTLDAFDFFLVVLCLKDIAKEFKVSDTRIALCTTLTLAMRPVGALIFGVLADRYGRRKPLMINVVFYSTLSILSGFAPGFTSFLICRMLFGIGMGGEWGVGATLAMEKVSPRWRGLLSGVLQEGYAVGNLLASAAYFTIFPHWGWRPLFIIGGAPALLALFVRFAVKESEVWEKTKKEDWGALGSSILSHWRVFLTILIVMFMMNLSSHGTQDMFPKLLKDQFHFSAKKSAVINAISAIGMIFGGVTVGLLSDRIGRRRAIVLAFILAIFTIPLWAYSHTTAMLALGAFLIQFCVQGAWGVIPAHITELSPDSVRGFLPGFAYQCAVALAGVIGYLQSALTASFSLVNAMAMTALIVFALAAVVIGFSRERRGVVFGTDATADKPTG